MAEQPWFKFYAADYLLDPDVDAMPREAEALLVRMWCICHREGSCPIDVETLARKTQCSQQYVSQFKPQCEPFFELRDGKLYSPRMEEEKRRSEQARENANKRFKKPVAEPLAKQMAEPRSDSDSDSDFDSEFKNPPPSKESVFALEENARAREASQSPKYRQKDFDARDLRKLQKVQEKFEQMCRASTGGNLPAWMCDDRKAFEWKCGQAGITVERGLELEAIQMKWPEAKTLEASS